MKIFIIAGESSGDMHAANLVREMNNLDPNIIFQGWGGDKMISEKVGVIKHIHELAFMGFVEVLINIRTILQNFKQCKKSIIEFEPDAVILVDYPGFNLRMAKFLHQKQIPVYYYISPQIWAWKKSRVHKIRRYVSKMFCILPFEKEFYSRYNYDVSFVGHPLLDEIAKAKFQTIKHKDKKQIAILPGSRKQEISKMLPVMIKCVARFPDFHFVLAGMSSHGREFYHQFIPKDIPVELVIDNTYGVLSGSHAALVTSGTATLETALFCVPQVVCYKGSAISYFLARLLIKVKYISLVNLILDQEIVTELIQSEFNPDNLNHELDLLLPENGKRTNLLESYTKLITLLGGEGASKHTANEMLKTLSTA